MTVLPNSLHSMESVVLPLPPMSETASGSPWRLRPANEKIVADISQCTGLDPVISRALAARGVTAECASSYLNPMLRESLPDPFVFKDMDRAVARLENAVTKGETIGVFGDYDVDGTTAAASLKLYFDQIGAKTEIYLPDRILEGYGPSIEAFRDLASKGAKVVATVDCGAAAHDVVENAVAEGLDVVIFDHHQMTGQPPAKATATVNPNRQDDTSGLNNLSAAGVAFMALVALNRALRKAGYFETRTEPDLKNLLDLTALGLVCDVMQMTGVTRTLVAQGLKVLGGGGNPGLAALGARCGMKGAPSSYHLGFLLGPRINAAGRIGHARLALELLTSQDDARLAELADRLHVMNAERQQIEAAVLQEAALQAERAASAGASAIIVAGEGWHPGVIGIVAGRLKEQFDRPVFVFAIDGEAAKGSGRSISGVDLGAAVSEALRRGLLIAGGGHAIAAGASIARKDVDAFSSYLNEVLARDVISSRSARRIEIDAVIAPSAVSRALSELVEKAGPFGPGNPEPIFALTNVRADFVKIVGDNHLACTLLSESGESVRSIAFRSADKSLGELLQSGRRIHVAGKIRSDDWRGGDAGQLQIADVAYAE